MMVQESDDASFIVNFRFLYVLKNLFYTSVKNLWWHLDYFKFDTFKNLIYMSDIWRIYYELDESIDIDFEKSKYGSFVRNLWWQKHSISIRKYREFKGIWHTFDGFITYVLDR